MARTPAEGVSSDKATMKHSYPPHIAYAAKPNVCISMENGVCPKLARVSLRGGEADAGKTVAMQIVQKHRTTTETNQFHSDIKGI